MEIKEKLITRVNKISEELTPLEQSLVKSLQSLPKEKPDITKLAKLQSGFNLQALTFKTTEFVIVANLLIEEFNYDFNTAREDVKARYNKTKEAINTAISQNGADKLPQEFKEFLNKA